MLAVKLISFLAGTYFFTSLYVTLFHALRLPVERFNGWDAVFHVLSSGFLAAFLMSPLFAMRIDTSIWAALRGTPFHLFF